MLGPEESSRAIPPLAELLAIRRIESIYHNHARQTLCRHPFTGQDELYFYRCYHTLLRCNIFFRPNLITNISGKGKRHIPRKQTNYLIRSSEAEHSSLSEDLGKTGVVGSREGKNVAGSGIGYVCLNL